MLSIHPSIYPSISCHRAKGHQAAGQTHGDEHTLTPHPIYNHQFIQCACFWTMQRLGDNPCSVSSADPAGPAALNCSKCSKISCPAGKLHL